MKRIFAITILTTLIPAFAAAEDLTQSFWKIRITNYSAIAEQKSLVDSALWCSYESERKNTNHTPCQMFAEKGDKTERNFLQGIAATEEGIKLLEKSSRTEENTDHLQVLRTQLKEMKSIPTPMREIAKGIARGKKK